MGKVYNEMRYNQKYPYISNLKVLESEAGFYIGRLYYYSEDDYNHYSRESNYFRDREDAKRSLIDNDYIEYDFENNL